MPKNTRPPRRQDANRNRIRLISAAREVFAEIGPDAPLEEVATRASVSRTTLYRNFPTRTDLAKEIYSIYVERIEQSSADLREDEQGIVKLFELVLGMMIDDRSLFHVVSNPEMEWYQELVERMAKAFRPLVRRGKEAGLVREGVTLEDFRLAFAMAQAATHVASAPRRKQMKRRIRWIFRQALFNRLD